MRGGARGAVRKKDEPIGRRDDPVRKRLPVLLVTAGAGHGANVSAELHAAGLDVRVAELEGDLDDAARRIAALAEDGRLIICDCAGDRGCERAFFLCRAIGEHAAVLLALGEGAEDEPVEVLVAAMRKAIPARRIALLSDRVAESERPSGGARRTPPSARRRARLAAILRRLADQAEAWPENANFYV